MNTPNTSKLEMQLITAIAKRAESFGIKREWMSLLMDIEYAHADIPMDLPRLLKADDFNFMHDVCGIINHLNRETGKLEDCFVPRFAL